MKLEVKSPGVELPLRVGHLPIGETFVFLDCHNSMLYMRAELGGQDVAVNIETGRAHPLNLGRSVRRIAAVCQHEPL